MTTLVLALTDSADQGEGRHEVLHAVWGVRGGTAMLGAAAAMPGWGWWGVAFVLFAGFELWRSRRRRVTGAGGWGAPDHVAMGGVWLSLLMLWIGAVMDFGNVDFGRSLGGL